MAEIGPKRPYLLRAMHEWMIDNLLTPHIVVDATAPGVDVPQQHVAEGKIILNVSYSATDGLDLHSEPIRFSTRFSGVSYDIAVPVLAVLGIYAHETGQGMIFTEEESLSGTDDPDVESDSVPAKGKPELKVVK
ncbi:MAG: ClpXP protease specificity-enhancing factor [Gammaproteobacteria bacterium]|nr:ClpXP protease specificity-enhancing factor [Gammaproteobacteria bacterium]MDH3506699.1 ClpXP protease specificity-enhancing factor [Gammaproteobacteria bacterium]